MKRMTAAAGLLWLLAAVPAGAEEPAVIKVTKLLTTDATVTGQKLVLPSRDPQLIASIFEIPPGARLPRHKHPYARYAYVLDGDLTVDYGKAGPQHFHKGDFIVEAIGTWHFGMNSGTTPVRLLVIDQVEKGQPATVMAK